METNMSETVNIQTSISGIESGTTVSASATIAAAGSGADLRTLEIGTSEVEVTFGAQIGNAGVCVLKNLASANYVEVGFATGAYPLKILAGQFAVIPLAPATDSLFLKANTAAAMVQLYVHEA
jgi:hypothetical protein